LISSQTKYCIILSFARLWLLNGFKNLAISILCYSYSQEVCFHNQQKMFKYFLCLFSVTANGVLRRQFYVEWLADGRRSWVGATYLAPFERPENPSPEGFRNTLREWVLNVSLTNCFLVNITEITIRQYLIITISWNINF